MKRIEIFLIFLKKLHYFDKKLTIEEYEIEKMKTNRLNSINFCKNMKRACIILGTLGRQGSVQILNVQLNINNNLLI